MYRIIIVITLLFVFIPFYGQPEVNTIQEISVGENLLTGTEIKGIRYEFDNVIVDSEIDSTSGLLVLTMQPDARKYSNPRYGLVFNLNSEEIAWTKNLSSPRFNLVLYDSILFLGKTDSIYRIEIESGDSRWAVSKNVLAVYSKSNVMLTYDYDDYNKIEKRLDAVRLTDGSTSWIREIDLNYGVNDLLNLNDSTIMIVAAGLHKINLRSGVGWDYAGKTWSNDYSKSIGANIAGVAFGLLTGVFFTSTSHDVITGLVSNLVQENDRFYFASKNKLACLSDAGKEIWSVKLPNETGNTVLVSKDNTLLLINTGIAILNGRPHNYGESYFRAFDKNTGELKFSQKFNLKNNPILDQKLFGDTLNLIFKSNAVSYSLKDGKKLNEIHYKLNDNDRFKLIVKGEKLYVKTDSLYKSLYSLDTNSVCVLTENDKIYMVNRNLGLDSTQNYGKLYIKKMQIGNYTLLSGNSTIDVIIEDTKRVAQLNTEKTLYKYGSKLVAIKDNSVIVIDLEKQFDK